MAWKHDTFAIQPMLVTDEYRLLGTPIVLTPPRDGSMLDPEDVKAAFDEFFDNYTVNTVVMDDERAKDIAAWIEREKQVTVISWAQGNARQPRITTPSWPAYARKSPPKPRAKRTSCRCATAGTPPCASTS